MQPTQIHQTMAQQIDHVKPAHLIPGVTIGIEIRDELSITVKVPTMALQATVTYCPGPDLYALEVLRDDEVSSYEGVYCDQLGELIFGSDAGEWSMPLVEVYVPNPDDPDTLVRLDV